MKRFICTIVVLGILLLGSVAVFADPSPMPGSEMYNIKPPTLLGVPK